MELKLHCPDLDSGLSALYRRAFSRAHELLMVSAYLTEWDPLLKLNSKCHFFRLIIGKDFGITRKVACEAVMRWLPSNRKGQFLVADQIDGFHPKAVFWKEENDDYFAIIGSSNLTRAAFQSNYEANAYGPISKDAYLFAKNWVKDIEQQSIAVSEDWLAYYREAKASNREKRDLAGRNRNRETVSTAALKLPRPLGMRALINQRREQLQAYEKHKRGLERLFRLCASGRITSSEFYSKLPSKWSCEAGNRLQGNGWERKGKNSNLQALSSSFIKIIDVAENDRDDVVVQEIDWLQSQHVEARSAFLSEMLCLRFPSLYPVLNSPVWKYLKVIKFRAPRGSSEGVQYLDLAKKLRSLLKQNPDHPAKNLAELDTVIWKAYGRA